MTDRTYAEVAAEAAYLRERIDTLTAQRNALPRSDKAGAHELMTQILRFQSEYRRLKPTLARLQEREAARESHSMWVRAVIALYGDDAATRCFEWMKAERRREKEAA